MKFLIGTKRLDTYEYLTQYFPELSEKINIEIYPHLSKYNNSLIQNLAMGEVKDFSEIKNLIDEFGDVEISTLDDWLILKFKNIKEKKLKGQIVTSSQSGYYEDLRFMYPSLIEDIKGRPAAGFNIFGEEYPHPVVEGEIVDLYHLEQLIKKYGEINLSLDGSLKDTGIMIEFPKAEEEFR